MTHPLETAERLAGVDWAKAFIDRHAYVPLRRPIKNCDQSGSHQQRGGSGFLPEVQSRTDGWRFHRNSHVELRRDGVLCCRKIGEGIGHDRYRPS